MPIVVLEFTSLAKVTENLASDLANPRKNGQTRFVICLFVCSGCGRRVRYRQSEEPSLLKGDRACPLFVGGRGRGGSS